MKRADLIASIGTTDLEQIESQLTSFLRETRARSASLVDRTGRLLANVGDSASVDQIAFASLAAADFAASDQLAVLLGETEFATLYHHGERQSMFLADVDGWAILAALFDRRTTLGMVRIKTKGTVTRLSRVFNELAERGPTGSVVQMEVGWAADAESEIDRLFTE
jgi:predicted regulator of Ras-like GTPase activity (Roadblock/LC7/MglB family)